MVNNDTEYQMASWETMKSRLPRIVAIAAVVVVAWFAGMVAIHRFEIDAPTAFLAGIVVWAILVEPIANRLKTWK